MQTGLQCLLAWDAARSPARGTVGSSPWCSSLLLASPSTTTEDPEHREPWPNRHRAWHSASHQYPATMPLPSPQPSTRLARAASTQRGITTTTTTTTATISQTAFATVGSHCASLESSATLGSRGLQRKIAGRPGQAFGHIPRSNHTARGSTTWHSSRAHRTMSMGMWEITSTTTLTP